MSNSTLPSTFNSRAEDGVWIRDRNSLRGGSTLRRGDDEDSSETSTQLVASSIGTNRTNSTWNNADYQPIEQLYGRGTSSSQTTNVGFAKQGAVKKDAKTRAQERINREKQMEQERKQAQELADESGESDDDGSDGEWEL
ncbi:uncharacterized protein HMPREF1541_02380 [Cyphellophora europaea CBS 101466]|uniref:Uncharacterized protein n=1 Tax=Cyphellophora europaea (strain CBS 101466) TaxID=1220924 RepID=W2S3D0_CYPE1|nr:uncharacterized protein HMPREF1541_02380 [Cyphellophora europaea CBS 101466]ETN43221.1 hypothetical protein HMPREF1541_02380 [Cyphellophora europaea CBS 101466]